MTLAEITYRTTESMPAGERFGLISQMRRAAVSVPSNIAAGQGRRPDGEFLNQLSVAHGSLRELETQILLSARLDFLGANSCEQLMNQCGEVGRLINGLARSIEQ
jgi:four helix bundle protein